jgi:hypothetical protein
LPADAFSEQRPCFQATSLFFGKKENLRSEGGKVINTLDLPASFLIKGQSMQLRL